jgi:SNF2 family DNA or RNA helicase
MVAKGMHDLGGPVSESPVSFPEPAHGLPEIRRRTPAGIPMILRFSPGLQCPPGADLESLRLCIEHARLRLLRGFDELLCLNGVQNVEHFPHQIETVRKVLRYFRGRVLLADEVGLGKTIEACLLLREFLLRGLARRVLILVPTPLVSQWREELQSKFGLEFAVPGSAAVRNHPEYWQQNDLVLTSMSLAKSRSNFSAVTTPAWDLVIVDEAHHCKNRETLSWKLVDRLKRRHLFLLTATPVQNNLVELYNLLTLLEPGYLKTEKQFKKEYVRRGNPFDPRNRERLRSLLGEVMVRNTRSLVNIGLPPRYAQTIVVTPGPDEAELYRMLDSYLRWRYLSSRLQTSQADPLDGTASDPGDGEDAHEPPPGGNGLGGSEEPSRGRGGEASDPGPFSESAPLALTRMQLNHLLLAAGSHPTTLVGMLERMAAQDPRAVPLVELARKIRCSAKEAKLIELLRANPKGKTLVFAGFLTTLRRLGAVLAEAGIPFSVFSGDQTAEEKDRSVAEFRERVPVMLCSESGGEGRNLQFANTLINFDLPWNPMKIEQRVGRIHRIGQTREVFIFNLCTAESLEARILRLLNDKIRMFELVVGEVGSILGNLEGGDEFETLVLNLWVQSRSAGELDTAFETLGDSLLDAQEAYLRTKELDAALFGDDYE